MDDDIGKQAKELFLQAVPNCEQIKAQYNQQLRQCQVLWAADNFDELKKIVEQSAQSALIAFAAVYILSPKGAQKIFGWVKKIAKTNSEYLDLVKEINGHLEACKRFAVYEMAFSVNCLSDN